ncbi:hypothetical protein CYMTET_28363 [Cymbomonas tetramitiformis]|uniref:Uncharacterized protein n=1 Tax=Cymbomonas tetramitiformis TaxID=36881 RepID=A0AAE0FN31_9CHLO|nr:hypothetical protein CYMTET_28363 [Cymbomonas tetramitiformis]
MFSLATTAITVCNVHHFSLSKRPCEISNKNANITRLKTARSVWSNLHVRRRYPSGPTRGPRQRLCYAFWNLPTPPLPPGLPDLSGDVIASAATFTLQQILRSHKLVETTVDCTVPGLLQGGIEGVVISGKAWCSPKRLTCHELQFEVGKVQIDTAALLTRQTVILAKPSSGRANVALTEKDFGNFLDHPLMQVAVQRAPLRFEKTGDVHIRNGKLCFTAICRRDSVEYEVQMYASGGDGSTKNVNTTLMVKAKPTSADQMPDTSKEEAFAETVKSFFTDLTIDLSGAEIRYQSMRVEESSGSKPGLIHMSLKLFVRQFPSLNIANRI